MAISIQITLILCASIQVGFWVFIFSKLAFYTKIEKTHCCNALSLIVCYKNESDLVPITLPRLIDQEKSELEIILVDDCSSDDTALELNKFRSNQVTVTSVHMDLPGKKLAIKTGIDIAKNELLLFTDADCIPASKKWAQIMCDHSKDSEIVLGYSPYKKQSGLLNVIVRYETWLTAIQYLSYAIVGLPYMGVGRNLLYKKSVFLEKNGFEGINDLASGDDDLMVSKMANRTNTTICIEPESFVYSFSPSSFRQWIKQKSRHVSTAARYKPITKTLLVLFSGTHILFYCAALFGLVAKLVSPTLLLGIIGTKWLLQSLVNFPAMKKMNEQDLWLWFPLLDIIMAVYYLILSPYLMLKDKTKWN